MKTVILAKLVLLLGIVFVGSMELHSQETAKDSTHVNYSELSLEQLMNVEITTAGKHKQIIGEVPANTIVITRSDIESYGYQSIKEILTNVPGMYMIDDYRAVGFGVRGFFSNVPNRNIVFLINGVKQQQSFQNWNDLNTMNLQVESIEQIEIVKGPQAIIYGNDAFFGAINIITNKVGEKINSSATTAYGTDNTYRANVQINSATPETTLNVSAGFYHTDGRDIPFSRVLDSVQTINKEWIKNGTTKDFFKQNSQYINMNIYHKGFYSVLSYDETDRNIINNFPPIYGTTKPTRSDYLLRSKIGYRKEFTAKLSLDANITFDDYYGLGSYVNALAAIPIDYGLVRNQGKTMNYELITFIKPVKDLNITVGANYKTYSKESSFIDIPQIGINRSDSSINSQVVERALFSQAEYKISPKLFLLGGIRLDKQNPYEFKDSRFVGNNYQENLHTYSYNKILFIPRLAMIYNLNQKNIIKLMYNKAISRPGINENSYSLGVPHPQLIPQIIQSTEVNYLSSVFRNTTLNFSMFYNKLDNLLIRRTVTDATGKYVNTFDNSGELKTFGGEFQLSYKPLYNLVFDASIGYQKTKNLTFDNNAAYSPNVLANLKAIYTFKEDIIFGLTSYYVGSMESEWDETPIDPINGNLNPKGRIHGTTPGYFNLGANARFNNLFKTKLYFNIHGTNILNKDIFYPPTLTNNSYLPNGTYDSGINLSAALGLKF